MRVWSHRRLSPEESCVVGIVGEMHAYRFLRKEFGGRAVHASAWVSESRLKVLPLVEGERDKTSDGHGFNFRFNHNGVRWHVEVKATKGEEPSFDLGISEIEAATRIARRRGNTWRWRILRVRNALSKNPEIDWLPRARLRPPAGPTAPPRPPCTAPPSTHQHEGTSKNSRFDRG